MLLIKNAKLYDMAGIAGEKRDLLIENGKIAAVAPALNAAPDCPVIDAAGRIVTPGFVDGCSTVGVNNQIHRFESSDADETGATPVLPQLRALDAIDTGDVGFRQARYGGITTAITGPGRKNICGGTYAAFKTGGESFAKRVVVPEVALSVVVSNDARGDNPGALGVSGAGRPATRMASAYLVRGLFMKGREYHRAKLSGAKLPDDPIAAAAARIFEGLPVKFTALMQNDIETAIRLAEEFGIENYSISMGYDAVLIPETFKQKHIPLTLGPVYHHRSGGEGANCLVSTPAKLEALAVEFALSSAHAGLCCALFPLYLGILRKNGLTLETLLRAVTLIPARIHGLDDRLGSLAVGKDADLVMWSGELGDFYTRADVMLIDGEPVDTTLFDPLP